MCPPSPWNLYLPFDSECARNISWCFIWVLFNLLFLNNITDLSLYQIFVSVQCKDPLNAFCDHLGEIRFYLSNLTLNFSFSISYMPPTSFFRQTQKILATRRLQRLQFHLFPRLLCVLGFRIPSHGIECYLLSESQMLCFYDSLVNRKHHSQRENKGKLPFSTS